MSYVRQKGEKGQYRVIDSKCLGRECFQPGEYQTRGGTLSGSRNTGNVSLCCLQNAYRGCPNEIPVRTHGALQPVTHQMDNWAVDTWELGEVRATLADGGSSQALQAPGLGVWRTHGGKLGFTAGGEARLRLVAAEVLP